jgi:ribosomal protein S18 acetylase RimI-like enzyme
MSDRVLIRDLEEADLPAIVSIHMAAFAESALTKLGKAAVHRYYEWQFTGPHDLTVLGAFIENQLVGFCFGGTFHGAMSGFLRKNRRFLIGRVLTHPWFVLNPMFRDRVLKGFKWLPVFKVVKQSRASPKGPGSRSFGILAIAVGPRHQGLGVGRLLMSRAEETAKVLSFDEMRLTVQPHNQKAVDFYECLRWEKVFKNGVWNGEMKKNIAGREGGSH